MTKQTTITTGIKRETEKAILIEALGFSKSGSEQIFGWWLPKSKVTVADNAITVPNWLLSSKLAESGSLSVMIGNQSFDKLNFM